MANPDPAYKSFPDDDDDEDQQIVFKRRNLPSKPAQANSAQKKQSSQQSNKPLGSPANEKKAASSSSNSVAGRVTPSSQLKSPSSNGAVKNNGRKLDSDDSEDDKPISFKISQSSKVASKPPSKTKDPGDSEDVKPLSFRATSSSGQKSSGKAVQKLPQKASVDLKEEYEDSDDEKPLRARVASASSGQKSGGKTVQKPPQKSSVDVKEESEDSDDEKPLSARVTSASSSGQKSSGKSVQKQPQKSSVNVKEESEDSEDEKPLSFRVASASSSAQKSSAKTVQKLPQKSSADVKKKTEDSEDEKPLASRFQQNGSNKRPHSGAANVNQSSNKKPKPLEKTPVKVNDKGSAKEEVKTDDDDDDDDDDDEDDYVPISQRTKNLVSKQKASSSKKVVTKVKAVSVEKGKVAKKPLKNSKVKAGSFKLPPGSGGGQKWTTLEHCGVIFPPPYKPHGVKMLYNKKPVDLTPEQEEVATMFAVMKETEYATKKTFIDNFMRDWKTILGSNHIIKQFELCDFTPIYEWSLKEKEKKKQMTSEEKKALKEEKMKLEEKYMWAIVDGVKEKVGNFRVEPPGLFRGRGEHPKMGKLKRRIRPRDITINIGKDAPVPECPIPGERWKEIRHDNTVTWLAFWNDPINVKEMKYVFLAASSSLKGQSDKEKYEKARKLKDYIHSIRRNYTRDFSNKDDTKKQVAVATYLIDKLALRAGNEKEEGEEADTVGCCTLKVENVMLVPPNKLQFDFLGKDSIRYFNTVEVEPAVYKAVGELRMKNHNGKKKESSDPLFHMLDTSKLNAHLKELMPGLTAKVFRTYNASITLDDMLNVESKPGTAPEKLAVYQQANKEVAIICNHQRSVSKSHDTQMSRLNEKLEDLKTQRDELEEDLSRAKKGKPPRKDSEGKAKKNISSEALEKKITQLDAKIEKIELERRMKEDLKTVALGTSKINYLDPRISVAWCKRNEVPIEKVFNKSLLAKFSWAMDVDPDFRF